MNIKDKVIIITGASSGIGEVTARTLAKQGAKVVLTARRKDRLEKITDEIIKDGGKAEYYEVDVTNRNQVENMINEVAAKHGRIDVLVGNAGLMATGPFAERRVEDWDRMIDINIKGVLYGIAAVLPIFEKQGKGHFVNIASIAGLKVAPGNSVYCGTKFAVRAISEGLRMEYAGKYRVTVISPGYIESELKYGSSNEAIREKVVEAYKQYAIPSESIANAIAYAISQPENTGINEIVVRPTSQEF